MHVLACCRHLGVHVAGGWLGGVCGALHLPPGGHGPLEGAQLHCLLGSGRVDGLPPLQQHHLNLKQSGRWVPSYNCLFFLNFPKLALFPNYPPKKFNKKMGVFCFSPPRTIFFYFNTNQKPSILNLLTG